MGAGEVFVELEGSISPPRVAVLGAGVPAIPAARAARVAARLFR